MSDLFSLQSIKIAELAISQTVVLKHSNANQDIITELSLT